MSSKSMESLASVEEKPSLWREFLAEVKRSGETTTAHGLPHILTSSRLFVKLLWLVFTLISIGLCCFMIARNAIFYFSYETNSMIRQQPQPELKFPLVSLCYTNPMITPEGLAYIRNYYMDNYGAEISTTDDLLNAISEEWIFDDSEWIMYETFAPDFNATLRRSFGYSLEQMLIKCEFDSKPCNLSWFEWFYEPNFGNCYKFNNDELLKVQTPNTGLYIEVFMGVPDEIYPYHLSQLFFNALLLNVVDHGHLPLRTEGIKIKPGVSASIGLSASRYQNQPEPYSSCVPVDQIDTEMSRAMKNSNITYDRVICINLCQQMLLYNNAGCYKYSYPNIFKVRECLTLEEYYNQTGQSFSTLNCVQYCPSECELEVYNMAASFADFPTASYANQLILDKRDHFAQLLQTEDITYELLRKSTASVNIYFEDLIVTEVQQEPSMLLIDLISNIGGHLGLFIGVSVLSFFEIFELGINSIMVVVRNRKNKNVTG